MSVRTERFTQVSTPTANQEVRRREVTNDVPDDTVATTTTSQTVEGANLAVRVIWFIDSVLMILLGFRFVLALLGANPANAFANFIYTISHPFVAPFFSLFGYNLQYGVSRFETYTLVAMAVYSIFAWLLTRLFTLNRNDV